MKFGFVGAGKVGCSLGKYLSEHEITVTGYYSRSEESAKWAAKYTRSEVFHSLQELAEQSDAVFLTVPDRSIASVYDELKNAMTKPMCFIHCSGLLSSEVFEGSSEVPSYGYSIHPLSAVCSKEDSYRDFSSTVFTIEGHPRYINELTELFRALGNEVILIDRSDKIRYHAAAAMASNLVVGLLSQSMNLMTQCGFSPQQAAKALKSLVKGNVEHVFETGCMDALTGPVERGDVITVKAHLEGLPASYRETYRALSRELLRLAKQKHPEQDYGLMEKLLTSGEEG